MTPEPLRLLLDRCDRADAPAADLAALEALLAVQEGRGAPESARAALEAVLGEADPGAVLDAAAGGARLASAFADLRDGLVRASEGVDVAREVVGEIAPGSAFEAVVTALSAGLDADTRRLDLTDTVLASVGGARPEASSALAAAVAAEAGPTPSLADAVMERLETEDTEPMAIMALVDGALPPERRTAVAVGLAGDPAALRASAAMAALGRDLRAAIRAESGRAPEVWPAVARELGLEREVAWSEAMSGLGAALRAGAPDLTDAVDRALAPAPAPVRHPAPQARRPRPVPVYALLAAAAATVLLVVNAARLPIVGPGHDAGQDAASTRSTEPPIVLADLNDTRIDDLQVDPGAMVQVFQLEGGAPMIIFLDEGSSGGVVL